MSLWLQSGAACFTVKVKARTTQPTTFLFGSDTVSHRFDAKFILVVNVDTEGSTVKLSAKGPAAEFHVCTLQRGQTFAMQIFNLSAVWAEADEDLRVHCAILPVSTP